MKTLNLHQCQSVSGGFYISIGLGSPNPTVDPTMIIGLLSFGFSSGAYAYSKMMGRNDIPQPVYEKTE